MKIEPLVVLLDYVFPKLEAEAKSWTLLNNPWIGPKPKDGE